MKRRIAATRSRGLAMALAVSVSLGTFTTACSTLDGGPRAARGSAQCARAAVGEVVTPGTYDKRAHCLGAAQIARRCSVAEARLAMYGKEFADAFGAGHAETRDLSAGRRGIECARRHAGDVAACCAAAGY